MELLVLIGVTLLVLVAALSARPAPPQVIYMYTSPTADTDRGGCGTLIASILFVLALIWLFSA